MTRAQVETADAGVEGNSRLTSATGVVLLVLLAVEGVTVLRVRQLITLHVFLGVVLIGPVLLKSGSTVYRFARYYRGTAPYRGKGPPPLLLRVLGPVVIVTSLLLLGSGVALLTVAGWPAARVVADRAQGQLLPLVRRHGGACARPLAAGTAGVLA